MTDSLKNTSLHINVDTHVPENSLVITFDDGWADNYTNVFPILREYGLIATIFVITGSVGQSNYMNWNQLREMSEAGISIQSHTVSHKPLAQLRKAEVGYELETSKKTIEDHLGTQVNFLSLPHGVYNKQVFESAQDAGYQAVCSSEPGVAHIWKGLPFFKRINISYRYRIDLFEKIVQGDPKIVMKAFLTKKIKNIARGFLGYKIYRRIYLLKYDIKD
jgi:peptidoglycan/xylan/chitin deacetylase (PgdA/CDA1 family)